MTHRFTDGEGLEARAAYFEGRKTTGRRSWEGSIGELRFSSLGGDGYLTESVGQRAPVPVKSAASKLRKELRQIRKGP